MPTVRYAFVLVAVIVILWECPRASGAVGSFLRDVELIAPSPQAELNTVYYYPSYVKGEDPVEEYNRRRLHVDTAAYMEPEAERTTPLRHPNAAEDCCLKRKRKYRAQVRQPKMRMIDAHSDHEFNYQKVRKDAGGPRYVRDDVEVFDIERESNRIKQRKPIRRRTRSADSPRRYEESDPQVFAYERTDGDANDPATVRQDNVPQSNQYFQDTFQLQKSPLELEFGHLFESNDGWEERYERQDHQNHRHQGKVKWADKKGGFGEHYWDLNHIQPNGAW
ncbi:uncharacterized protein LOC128724824 [Anopheles nili]|uniref:uncharacterized protein LOC128724824 n=1 Tax=Anopheles nili TaxID=185578 RepID=UPI00237C08D4|nr:uncharacterized protein LOC128724824 [Anopheles nili]